VIKYHERLSGPLLDRIDLYIETPSLEYDELRERSGAEPSSAVRSRVNRAREFQHRRYEESGITCNARIGTKQLEEYCSLSSDCEKLMRDAYSRLSMTARSYDRVLRVARTVADLDQSESIEPSHLAEAIRYRMSILSRVKS
jgi:magnesium chelatase family protein